MTELHPFYEALGRGQNDATALAALADFAADHDHPLSPLFNALHQSVGKKLPYNYDHFDGGHHSLDFGEYGKGGRFHVQHSFNPTKDGNVHVGVNVTPFAPDLDHTKATNFAAVVSPEVAEAAIRHLHAAVPDQFYWEHKGHDRSQPGYGRDSTADPVADLHLSRQHATGRIDKYARDYAAATRN